MAINLGMGQSGLWNNGIDVATGQALTMSDSAGMNHATNTGMMPSEYSSNISNWLQNNNTATDGQVRTQMDQYGVTPRDVASAMGWDVGDVTRKYDAQAGVAKQNSMAPPSASGQPQGSASAGYTKSPYLDEMAAGITSQMNDNWTRNQLPSIRSGAMAAGGFGGSRQGVVEANGLNDMNRSLGQNLTNLYGTDYTNAQNRNLQQQSINNSFTLGQGQLANQAASTANQYNLGLRASDLGFAGLDAGIANSNFSNQLQAANFGMNAYSTMNNQTATGIQAGTNIQNTPLDYQKYFTGSASGVGSGFGNTTTSATQQGNPYASAIGGALMGNQIYNGYKG